MSFKDYTIIEKDIGPVISESRMTVYDIMLAQQEGDNIHEICGIYNLKALQVQAAFDYIEEHREVLEAELPGLVEKRVERERRDRAITEELIRKCRALPMTPERKAFYELHEKNKKLLQEKYGY